MDFSKEAFSLLTTQNNTDYYERSQALEIKDL
jgi:hypothetical protein